MGQSAAAVSDSEFAMWRAVFAFALVDNVLSVEEQDLLKTYYTNIPFSPLQRAMLKEDFKYPQDVSTLFKGITEARHRERFCVLARALVWCEGNMDEQERLILKHVGCLSEEHYSGILKQSRNHPSLRTYHENYARAGVIGLMKLRSRVELQI